MDSLAVAGVEALWERWLSDYWRARITGVPRQREESERQPMVAWLGPLAPRLALAIDRVISAPSTLDAFTFYRLRESGIAMTAGEEIGGFLRRLLPNLTAVTHDFGEVSELANQAADHGAVRADLLAIVSRVRVTLDVNAAHPPKENRERRILLPDVRRDCDQKQLHSGNIEDAICLAESFTRH